MRGSSALIVVLAFLGAPMDCLAQRDRDQRLGQLTLAEKAALLTGKNTWETLDIPRLGIPSAWMADGPAGLRKSPATGLGLAESAPATAFPSASALAATWNPELVRRVGAAIGGEAAAQGVTLLLAPGLNLKRHPLGGRNFEYYSEDPLLSGRIAAAYVDGVQSRGVGATLKHYAVNNQEHRRMVIDARVGERALRELYLRGFEIAVREGRPAAVMTSYNSVNGTAASHNAHLITDILRGEWGFEGLVVSDWGGVRDPVAAIRAGADLEMPGNPLSPPRIEAAVRAGSLPLEAVDRAVGNVLRLVHLPQWMPRSADTAPAGTPHEVAVEAAEQSIVLLENDGVLPLDLPRRTRLGVVGTPAFDPRIQGIGSSQVNPSRVDTVWGAIRDLGGARGLDAQAWPAGYAEDSLTTSQKDDLRTFVRDVDVVIAVVGQRASHDAEAWDRPSADLSPGDREVMETVLASGKPVVAVVVGGGAVDMSPLAEANAVLFGWLGGQGFGTALARILFGEVNPSGRLSETFARAVSDHASSVNFPGGPWEVDYGEGLYVGYRYFLSFDRDVAYPFGYGRSYTTFDFLRVEAPDTVSDLQNPIRITVDVQNSGTRQGAEVVQVYLRHRSPSLPRPDRELVGFAKVPAGPGEVKRVTIPIAPERLSYYHDRFHRWVTEPGEYELLIGASAADIKLSARLVVTAGTMPREVYTLDHTLADLYADERGRIVVDHLTARQGIASLAEAGPGDFMAAAMKQMTLRQASGFSDGALTLDALEGLLALINSDRAPSEVRAILQRGGG
jgi:beta-glucosidase